jgi:putative MATE family efflux protein
VNATVLFFEKRLMFKTLKDYQFIKRFFSITFPVMVQMIISFFVSFIDNIMVGGISSTVVSAVYAVNQISFFFIVLSYGLFSGSSIYVQQFFGAKDPKHLVQAVRYKIMIAISFLLIFIPLVLIFGENIIGFYARSSSDKEQIIQEALLYLPIIVLSFIPYKISNIYSSTYREIGKTKVPMYVSMVSLFTNAFFNYFFIYVVQNGIQGVGFATLIARLVEVVLLISFAHLSHEPFTKNLYQKLHVELALVVQISKKTAAMLLNEIMWAGGIIMQSLAFASRPDVLSTLSIVSTTTEIFGIIFAGLAVGVGVMVGSTLGSGQLKEAKTLSSQLIWMGILISLSLGTIIFLLAPYIPLLWPSVGTEQKLMATQIIRLFTIFLSFFSIANVTYHILRSGGKTTQTLLLDGVVMWLGTVPLVWSLALFTSIPLVLMYLLIQIVDIVKALFGLYLVKRGDWIKNLANPFEKTIEKPVTSN